MSTYRFRLTLSYCGIGFEGWQIQLDHQKTIQGELNKALAKISKSKEVKSLGSGRTDSGVHALCQVCAVQIPLQIESDAVMRALNSHLPFAIRVLKSEVTNEDFHPVRDALWKRYEYVIWDGEILPPHWKGMVTHFPRTIDWVKADQALSLFEGSHDFKNFSTKGTEVSSTVRTIFKTKREKRLFKIGGAVGQEQAVQVLIFEGEGFLKQMVRLLVGAAVSHAQGKASLEEIRSHFDLDTSQKIGAVAPADGLYLAHVEYTTEHPSIRA